jgi:transposase
MDQAAAIPNDIECLKLFALEKCRELDEKNRHISEIERALVWAEEKYRNLELKYFGRKSERYAPSDDKQNRLFNEAEAYQPDTVGKPKTIIIKQHERVHGGRKRTTRPTETKEIVHDLSAEEKACPCCGKERPLIGTEKSEEIDYVPAKTVLLIHIKNKYGPCSCEGFTESDEKRIVTAKGPAKIIKGSDFTNGTIAMFVTAKYADGLPFYRMESILDRIGLGVSRTTLCNLAMGVGSAVSELIDMMWVDMRSSDVIQMDETRVQVLKEPNRPPTSQSFMWVNRGFFGKKAIVIFHYHQTRSGEVAKKALAGFKGYLQTDGYGGYEKIGDSPGIVHVGCFAHIRRKFHDAFAAAGKTGTAEEMLVMIRDMYQEEERLRTMYETNKLSENSFTQQRKEEHGKRFSVMREWLLEKQRTVAPQSLLGKAVSYALGQWEKATRFVEHPILTPDDNGVENAIRPFVIGRKAWLFSDTPRGAHASAALYSIIETAKANGHEPLKYLTYLFNELPKVLNPKAVARLLPYRLSPKDY